MLALTGARAGLLALAVACGTVTAVGESPALAAPVTRNQIAVPAAPMGWASWNTFFENIDHNVIKSQADALVSKGLASAGYEYVNIDSGWWKGTRDAAGNITVDQAQWPGGMKAIADYIHSKGLKAGIYTDAGRNGCGYYFPTPGPPHAGTGSEGHYEQDMLQFSKWGFDYVKVDWCGADVEKLDAPSTYQALSDAVTKASAATGRDLVLSICEWGKNDPWNWAPGMAPLWRTGTDIIFAHETPSIDMVYENFDKNQRPTAQHTGYYNDPDMMMIGMPGLSPKASRVHMSLWAVGGSPMLLGNDLTKMDDATISVLTNREVVAVGQDPRGLPAVEVAEDVRGQQVYAKVLSGNGHRAVALLNRTSSSATMTLRLADLGLSGRMAAVRNLWTGATSSITTGSHSVTVPAGDVVMLSVTGAETTALPVENSRVTASAGGLAVATIEYANGERVARKATLQVNGGQVPTAVALPPTGSAQTKGTVSVIVSLAKGPNSFALTGDATVVEVRELPGTKGTEVIGTQSGRCVDINRNTITNGTQAQLWDCNGGVAQTFTHNARKELVVYGDKCLDAWDHGTTNGTKVAIYDCTGGTNQQWNLNADGTITGVQSGLCLDAHNAATANGTLLVLWSCNGNDNQKWTRN
ncbi:ricin-type beta-trefoil lectin domain protein [Lentzea sp. NPDC051838]|uniref:ricin-type beta-trefoil lectin domain protein n=1 Tax=Lentzea sp. NPDC051838 TaxID=3154849 RepID=UPI00341E3EA7